jgi:hypothetical protein
LSALRVLGSFKKIVATPSFVSYNILFSIVQITFTFSNTSKI